jgi:nitroreductase
VSQCCAALTDCGYLFHADSQNPHLKNRLLSTDIMPNFAEDLDDFLNTCNKVYHLVLKAVALGLGTVPVGYFEQFHKAGGEPILTL